MRPYLLALLATLGVIILGLLWAVLANVTMPLPGGRPSPAPQPPPTVERTA